VRAMQPDDVYRFTAAGDPRVSPDGRTIAHVVSWVDGESHEPRSAIWSVPADGSASPRRLTFGGSADANPRWSPDGRWLAFTSARGETPAQLFVLPVDGPGESRQLTELQQGVGSPAWSPDSMRIAFSARAHDPGDDVEEAAKRPPRVITRLQYCLDNEGWTQGRTHHIYVVPLDDGEPVQLTDGDFEDQMPAWSPDGATIAFVSARGVDWDLRPTTRLYTIGAHGGVPAPITPDDGACLAPSWSPDGGRIAYIHVPGVMDDPRHGRVAVLDLATGATTVLTEDLDRNAATFPLMRGPVWDGERLLFVAEDRGRAPVFAVRADGSQNAAIELEVEGYLSGFDLAGGTLVHAASTPTRFAEVFVGDRRLTDVSAAFLADVEPVAPEPFTATSADGAEVPAWIMRPPDFDPDTLYPAVLNIHGGPFTQYGDRFFDEFQMYAAAGYVVIYANPRGSSGYEESWGRAIRGPVKGGPGWGSVDFEDLMTVTDEAVKRFPFIDAERLGVMGGSYGGYMTSWIVGHTDRFACAISERAVNDVASEDGTADFAGFFRGYVGADFWEDPEAYRRISPIAYAEQMMTPLLILHSEDDLRCPINQGEQLFTILRSRKREVEFVRFPGESHELTRSGSPTHRVQRFEIVLGWLDRYLAEEPSRSSALRVTRSIAGSASP
jgi:dipeptidyl aminopeptidase/acylaminoacyl peptidase